MKRKWEKGREEEEEEGRYCPELRRGKQGRKREGRGEDAKKKRNREK